MNLWTRASGRLMGAALLVLSVGLLSVVPVIQAQTAIPLTVSVPSLWENVLTPEIFADFESEHPGVTVHVVFTGNSLGTYSVSGTTVDDRLQNTEDFVTAGDVLLVSPSTLTQEDTQAGYFLDLNPLVMSDPTFDTNDFVPGLWQAFQWDNGVWALPFSTDVILVTFDPEAFDEASLIHPNAQWTIDDFAYAARQLAQYDSNGNVTEPGMMVNLANSSLDLFFRSLLRAGVYDPTVIPNAPDLSSPELDPLLSTWYDLLDEGVLDTQSFGQTDVPLRVEGVYGYTRRPVGSDDQTQVNAVLLPGNVAGLSAQGFAVSAGSQYPELAYALANYLTARPELTENVFSVAPARYSLMGEATTETGRFMARFRNIPDEIRQVIDGGLNTGLPVSEIRYIPYLNAALDEMKTDGVDALTALQDAEVQAINDMQDAVSRRDTLTLVVVPPAPDTAVSTGEITLTCGINQGLFALIRGGQLPNQNEWDQVIADFVASEPSVGAVILETTNESNLGTLGEQYDCFILPSNGVPGGDLSAILSLDPLLQADPTFDSNDLIGNVLAQVQEDNRTWALPLSFQVQMLEYDPQQFARAGVPEPVNGWTADTFIEALHLLKEYDPDVAPFAPNDPSGSYVLLLIGAFGGLPVDYRTTPATINFTDPATVDAIRQVLDLAIDGYFTYTPMVRGFGRLGDITTENPAITTSIASEFNFMRPGQAGSANSDSLVKTIYPQGSAYNVAAIEITTGYISASAQNPDAAYRFLSQVSRNPQLFSGMPARQSLIYSPEVLASQGENVVELYQQLDTLMRAPNTIIFPSFSAGRGELATTIMEHYWLAQAFDRYVLDDADLDAELEDAEILTQAYQTCAQTISIDDTGTIQEQQRQLMQQILQCATSVDPSFSLN